MAKKIFGLKKVEFGLNASDGGVATSWVEVGETVSGTMLFTQADGTTTEFKIEENAAPVESVTTEGASTLAWSSYKVDQVNLPLFLGGTVTAAAVGVAARWAMPDVLPDIYGSLRVTDSKGNVTIMVRVKLKAKLNFSYTTDKIGQIDFVATLLAPEKLSEARLYQDFADTALLGAVAPVATLTLTAPATLTLVSGAVGGKAPYTYQWKKNGSNITGATSATFTKSPSVATTDSGTYLCVVTDATATAVNSTASTVTVN